VNPTTTPCGSLNKVVFAVNAVNLDGPGCAFLADP
jgi:hypothetical protein